jgi:hypothetical protein
VAFIIRCLWAFAGWTTSYIEAHENSITITYQRSAYLLAFGYGYAQTRVSTPAYFELSAAIDSIHAGKSHPTIFSENEIYPTQHYPPGWPLIGAGIYLLTHIPVAYAMQCIGILVDIFALFIFFRLCLQFGTERIALRSAWLYALFPPLIASSVSMSPDSFIIFFLTSIALLFTRYTRKELSVLNTVVSIGILNGIAALFRPDFILYPAFLSLCILFPLTVKKLQAVFMFNIAVGLITFILLLPWGMRNKNVSGTLSITTTSLGGTLITGLAALPNPWNLGPTDLDRVEDIKQIGLNKPFEYEADAYFKHQFLEYVADEPAYYLKAIGYRTAYFLLAPYNWGLERNAAPNVFSEARSDGKLFATFFVLIKNYWDIAISVSFNLVCYMCVFLLLRKKMFYAFLQFACIIVLSVYCTHIPIYITSTYILPISFVEIFIVSAAVEAVRKKTMVNI